jgi:aspartyl/asparaginyl beta-hydroxylase (cupin superfamily)
MMDIRRLSTVVNLLYKPWLTISENPFYDIDKVCPELTKITQSYVDINRESQALENMHLPQYHEIDGRQHIISAATEKRWNVFMLHILGIDNPKSNIYCPKTLSLVKSVPNVMQAFFSILEPGKSIPKHCGPYKGYLRYHLGLKIPKDNPPKIIVNEVDYTWSQGKAILFDDSLPHEVVNNAKEKRVILIIDILRPMPVIPHTINKFILMVIAKKTYAKKALDNVLLYD